MGWGRLGGTTGAVRGLGQVGCGRWAGAGAGCWAGWGRFLGQVIWDRVEQVGWIGQVGEADGFGLLGWGSQGEAGGVGQVGWGKGARSVVGWRRSDRTGGEGGQGKCAGTGAVGKMGLGELVGQTVWGMWEGAGRLGQGDRARGLGEVACSSWSGAGAGCGAGWGWFAGQVGWGRVKQVGWSGSCWTSGLVGQVGWGRLVGQMGCDLWGGAVKAKQVGQGMWDRAGGMGQLSCVWG